MLTTHTSIAQLSFEPPGPGTWTLDVTHFPRPCTRFLAEILPEQAELGFRDTFSRYGLLLDDLTFRVVNGFAYSCPKPVDPSELSARFAAADNAFESKVWRRDLQRWDEEIKPALIRAQLALQSVDPAALSNEALLDHLDNCRQHLKQTMYHSYCFIGPSLIPLGDFLVHAGRWTGLAPGQLIGLMKGASPISAGLSDDLDAVASAIRADRVAQVALASNAGAHDVIDSLRRHAGDVGVAARTYLDMVGYRLVDGYDVGDRYALEMPEVVVRGIRTAVGRTVSATAAGELSAVTSGVRDQVPADHRESFDELLAEARHTYRLREERSVLGWIWDAGITRRGILVAGARLAEQGRIESHGHLVEAGWEEMCALLGTGDGPSSAELADRATYRATQRATDAPPTLGPEPHTPPSLDSLPPAAARAMQAFFACLEGIFQPAQGAGAREMVRGLAASPGVYVGTARVVAGPAELGRLQPGDVLVTFCTSEAFNLVLPMVGAIVTDSGGLLSHPAIVAREYGIPAVVGSRNATARIADGARVRVDGGDGTVAVLA
jgi:phosphohistidine swiveling domain-containing protein